MIRQHNRKADEMRPVSLERNYTRHAEGSVLVAFGDTRVLCNATVEDRVPGFLYRKKKGWVTAEYSMLPRSTNSRTAREAVRGKQSGRTQEIQRLIARSLRAAVDLKMLGEHTITIDCDVIQADGGTRTAAITGGFVALADAVDWMLKNGRIASNPLSRSVASVSVGICQGKPITDLDYKEDSNADADMNVVLDDRGNFIEVQGTAELHPFSRELLDTMLNQAETACSTLFEIQKNALAADCEGARIRS